MTQRKPPQDCADMPDLRDQIDSLDQQIIGLLAERTGYIDRAIAIKQGNGWPARIPGRVEQVVQNARGLAVDQGLDGDLIEGFWRQMVEWSIAREARVIQENAHQARHAETK